MTQLKALKDAHRVENRAIYLMASTPDGKVFTDWMDKQTGKVLRKSPDGVVDPYAMAYAAGQYDFIKQIKDMIENGKMAR